MRTMTGWMSALALGIMLAFGALPGAAAAQTQQAAAVTPANGSRGTEFIFVANGFDGSTKTSDEDSSGERIAYWVNAPDGRIISADPDDGDDDKRDASSGSYVAKANRNGQVEWTWTAFAGLPSGDYVMVAHGLKSNHEVTIPFSVK